MSKMTLTTTLPIASKKSGQRIYRRRSGQPFISQNPKVKKCQRTLAGEFYDAAKGRCLFGTDSVSVCIVFDKTSNETRIEVESIGPKPKKLNGRKQDIVNQAQLILDAMEKSRVIRNDSQVAVLRLVRIVGGEVV